MMVAVFSSPAVYSAEACTYNEALLALKQGNMTRGQALMKMAANDGDQRALDFLASFRSLAKKQAAEKPHIVSVGTTDGDL